MSSQVTDRALSLSRSPLFRELSPRELIPLAALCTTVELDAGDLLFRAGDLGDAMYIVEHGSVEVWRRGTPVASIGEGECVGEMAALDWEPRSADVRAKTSCRLLRLERGDLLDIVTDSPVVIGALVRVLARRVRDTPGSPR